MAMPVETALEYLVTAAVRDRARSLMLASLPRVPSKDEVFPPIDGFIPQAVEALKRERDTVMSLLMPQ